MEQLTFANVQSDPDIAASDLNNVVSESDSENKFDLPYSPLVGNDSGSD